MRQSKRNLLTKNDNTYAIEVQGLTKKYGEFTAVDSISFNVRKGSIFGFLGPNGSGKTTCIKMLCGLLLPTKGIARVNGFDVIKQPDEVKATIGYMNQSFSLYSELTVKENLDFFGTIYGLTGDRLKKRKEEIINLMGIGPYVNKISGQLSGGWKQRLALGVALIHEPKLVFLDEPTSGIDPVARRKLWDLLFSLAASGITFFVTTHYMDEAERCDEVAYIYNSKLMVKGTPRQLKGLPEVNPKGTRRISVASDYPSIALMLFKKMPGIIDATLMESEVHLLIPKEMKRVDIYSYAKQNNFDIEEYRDIEPSLEDVFVTLTRSFDIL